MSGLYECKRCDTGPCLVYCPHATPTVCPISDDEIKAHYIKYDSDGE